MKKLLLQLVVVTFPVWLVATLLVTDPTARAALIIVLPICGILATAQVATVLLIRLFPLGRHYYIAGAVNDARLILTDKGFFEVHPRCKALLLRVLATITTASEPEIAAMLEMLTTGKAQAEVAADARCRQQAADFDARCKKLEAEAAAALKSAVERAVTPHEQTIQELRNALTISQRAAAEALQRAEQLKNARKPRWPENATCPLYADKPMATTDLEEVKLEHTLLLNRNEETMRIYSILCERGEQAKDVKRFDSERDETKNAKRPDSARVPART